MLPRYMFAYVLALSLVTGFAQTDYAPQYSRKQLRELTRNAKTPADHERLAVYFHSRERFFRAKETEQRLIAEHKDYPAKYPTRTDSSRHLASYYALQAQKASDSALEQERLAKKIGGEANK